MLCNAFLFFTFLLNTVNIRGSTTPPVPELQTAQNTSESTPTSGSTIPPVPELRTTQNTPESTTSGQCHKPTLPENVILKAGFDKQTYVKGNTARLDCAVGYTPASITTRTIQCLGDRWTDVGLQCKKKSCGALKEIYNGKYEIPDGIEYGAKVKAVCNKGYQLYGDDTRICNHNGWSGRDIECEVVKCTEIPSIENGAPEEPYGQYEFKQSVAYKCKKDFEMIGNSTITCSENGAFRPSPPECLRISCPEPDIPHATRMEGSSPYKLRSAVRYECIPGYKMTGYGSLVCQKHGWDPTPPNCTVVTCPKPSAVANGYPSPDKERYQYGETVTFSCKTGFRLEGNSKIICSQDESFQPSPPRCVVVTCPTPPAIRNGYLNEPPLNLYNYGQTVTYSCKEDFRLLGASEISCSENGYFLPSPPKCVRMCPAPPAIDNGRSNASLLERYDYGQAVTYSCTAGFTLKGASTVLCSEEGTFHPPPQCVRMCPAPPAIDNGRSNASLLERYDYGQAVTYSCTAGFTLKGASTVLCSEEGTFHPPPQCVRMCPAPPAIDNGRSNASLLERYDYGQAVTYSCTAGFTLKGASTVLCSEEGTFHPPPQCVRMCPAPPAIDNGRSNASLLERYDYGQAVTYSCTAGFRLTGASTVLCSEDGAFHPPPPQCDLHLITICIILSILVLLVMFVVFLCVRNQKNSGKVAVKTEEDGL